jgi:hypothetical protein
MKRFAMKTWLVAPCAALIALCVAASGPAKASVSAFVTAPDDPAAVVVKARGDGRTDDGAAIQAAIDAAAAKGGGGLVFLPSGRYRISKTLFLWPGVRVFGVGATRPQILLADATPGFQKGLANMVIFAGAKRDPAKRVPFPPPGSVPFDKDVADANPGTFYSAMSNIDFKIGQGNPAATAIRFHAAQHAFVSHMEFDIGSGLAGLHQVANEAEDLHFKGGRYGILAEKTSPAWGFVLLDSTFEGQRDAAIREHEAGLTLVNVAIRDTPVGIDIDRGYGDWLWGKDVRFENVSKAAVVISNENNVYTQVGFENALAANTPVFARFRDSGKTEAGRGRAYRVSTFTHGLTLPGLGQMGAYRTDMRAETLAALPARRAPAIRTLPATADWINVRTLGAKGDNAADDTAAIQKAIDTHRVVYFPAGFYLVSDTLKLRPDTVLVGLHPSLTQIVLPDRTPGYQGVGAPKALVASAGGGDAIVSGLGLNTSGINPRATALLWTAGAESLVNDVKFQGGHGTDLFDGTRVIPYNANGTADADPAKRWAGQYPSLWVTNGGGGTFANLWSPSTFAYSGIYVSDTKTPGRIYQASVEHHVRSEISLNRVANWELLAPQTEEEAGEGEDTVSLEIRDSHDILVANYHGYRVTRTRKPAAAAVRVYNSRDIRFRNVAVNGESGVGTCDENGCTTFLRLTKYPYENAILDVTSGLEVRERQFAVLDLMGDPKPVAPSTFPAGARVEKLADGFFSAGRRGRGRGRDAVLHRPPPPAHLQLVAGAQAVDRARQHAGSDQPGRRRLGEPAGAVVGRPRRHGLQFQAGRPRHRGHGDRADRRGPTIPARRRCCRSTGGTTASSRTSWTGDLPGSRPWPRCSPATWRWPSPGNMSRPTAAWPCRPIASSSRGRPTSGACGSRTALDTYGFTTAKPGQRVFVTNSSENKTYSGLVGQQGAITDLKVFADRGGESVATDREGRVYVANGQVFVYAPDGRELGRVDVPERPLQLVFGGPDKQTLFVLTHHALYAVREPLKRGPRPV